MAQVLSSPSHQFPAPLACLFRPKRYKVLYGGRGAGRSWGVARALILRALSRETRTLCGRELQKSIAESVHRLLADQIRAMGFEDLFKIEANRIYGPHGSFFVFEGLKNNAAKIKSYEGIDICWVEEAGSTSEKTWEYLIPTIRKEYGDGTFAEIWMTFNPELETDYTFTRFVKNPDGKVLARSENFLETEDSFIVKMTWRDNPWFPQVLMKEMENLKKRDPDAYLNVWEGNCRQFLQGAVFAKELRQAEADGRICRVPWDKETALDVFWDLGRRDYTAMWFAQRVSMQWRIVDFFEDSGEDIHYYLRHLQSKSYTYGTMYLPHDAKNRLLGVKRTIEQIVRAAGFKVMLVPRVNRKANAINAARVIFPTCWFDEKACGEGLNRLRHYRYEVKDGQLSEEPLHDDNSNAADGFMTLAQAIKGNKVTDDFLKKMELPPRRGEDESPNLHWMNR